MSQGNADTIRDVADAWGRGGAATAYVADNGFIGRKPTDDAIAEMEAYMNLPPPMGPILTQLSTVERKDVEWAWPQRIAIGKPTMFAGDPGVGKSTVSLDVASKVTTGSPWPDDPCAARREPGNVIIMSAEDDAADTIGPRCDAAGADSSRIHLMEGMRWKTEDGVVRERDFTLEDAQALEAAIIQIRPKLVIIDPVSAYMGDKDSHKNAVVRGLIKPLAALATKYRTALLIVTHLNKGGGGPAMYRASASLAFIAASRAAFAFAKDKSDPERRLMLPIKNNLGNDRDGLAYRIIGNGIVSWERGAVTTSADDALGQELDVGGEAIEAEDWLREALANGAVESKRLKTLAKRAGIAERTLWRAKSTAGVKVQKVGYGADAYWNWHIPADTKPANETTSTGDLAEIEVTADDF